MKPYTDEDKKILQSNLAVIRKVAGWTTADLGEMIGVTKQAISALENDPTASRMTKTQYIAIRSIIDAEMATNPDNIALAQVVRVLLDSENLSEQEREKATVTLEFVKKAMADGMKKSAFTASLATLASVVGFTAGVAALPISAPLWLASIAASTAVTVGTSALQGKKKQGSANGGKDK